MKLKKVVMIIGMSIILININCTRTVTKTRIIVGGDYRYQVVVDSLVQQIEDCEEALKKYDKAR
jgi:hypothetical protein